MKKPKLTRRQMSQYTAIMRQTINGGLPSATACAGMMFHPSIWTWRGFNLSALPGLGWAALHFARQYQSRDIDLKALERVVLRSGDPECAYQWARDIPGARIRKIQRMIEGCLAPGVMRAFAANIPGADSARLEALILVAEVLAS